MSPFNNVIDFHTHTYHSDGVLGICELSRRAQVNGYSVLGISDHVDQANLQRYVTELVKAVKDINGLMGNLLILPGVEITHVPPSQIKSMVEKAKFLGAAYVVVHGETISEPVASGTNLAAIHAGADILAHPGILTDKEASLAAERGVYLELSSRQGHCLGNGLIANMAKKYGVRLLVNSDSHSPSDLLSAEKQKNVALGAGLNNDEYNHVMEGAAALAARIFNQFKNQ